MPFQSDVDLALLKVFLIPNVVMKTLTVDKWILYFIQRFIYERSEVNLKCNWLGNTHVSFKCLMCVFKYFLNITIIQMVCLPVRTNKLLRLWNNSKPMPTTNKTIICDLKSLNSLIYLQPDTLQS